MTATEIQIINSLLVFMFLLPACTHVDTAPVGEYNTKIQPTSLPVSVYFSPDGGCEARVVELINSSKESLDVAIYSINNEAIVTALESAQRRGVKIRILIDRVQAAGTGNRATTLKLRNDGLNVRIHSKNRIQHNKFVISDGIRVETGSFNWTTPAEHSNEENCLFIDDQAIAAAYSKRFGQHLWILNTKEKSDQAFKRLESQ